MSASLPLAPYLPAPLVAGLALLLFACRSEIDANYVAELAVRGEPRSATPSEEVLAEELRDRAALLSLPAEIDPGRDGDRRLVVRFEADDEPQARRRLETLIENGALSIRTVHDQSAYLVDAARDDPSNLPAGHEIMTYTLGKGPQSRTETLVVARDEIVDGAAVERAEARQGTEHHVDITLSVSGGQQMMAATKNMQKGRSRLAIIYNGRMISAPVVGEVLGSEFSLEGFNSFPEAQAVAAALNKPLSAELQIESVMRLAP